MDAIDIPPAHHPIRKTVRIPGSKSITNRALPLAALAQGESHLTGVLFADDTAQMLNALQTLGYDLEIDPKTRTVRIRGRANDIPHVQGGSSLMCGNSGTTIRFLAAMLCLGNRSGADYLLDGVARMRQRPIDQLVDQLRALGAQIDYAGQPGFPPIRIRARGLAGGTCSFTDAKSSQFISAVLLAAPYATKGVTMSLVGPITSEPYVAMTLRMMEQFGVRTSSHEQTGARVIQVPAGRYAAQHYAIEPDASNASYFLAAAAVIPGSSVKIEGLGKSSIQGDAAFADVLGRMGAQVAWTANSVTVSSSTGGILKALDIDMNAIPDMVQTLAVVALFAQGTTTIRNVWNLRVKETDRLAALQAELTRLGAKVDTTKDSITVTPPPSGALAPASIATYDDHRMAMSFAIAGLRHPGIRIENPQCTAKTYPEFFQDLLAAIA